MKAEGMLQGRLGVREWLNVAQGGARGFLNGFYSEDSGMLGLLRV